MSKEMLNDEITEIVYFAKLKGDAIIPSKNEEDAGYDIYSNFEEDYMEVLPHTTVMIPTEISSAFSDKFVMVLKERGSTGTKGIAQRCGIIDSGFRGDWKIPITNSTDKTIVILKKGKEYVGSTITTYISHSIGCTEVPNYIVYPYEKAICQALLLPVPKVSIKEITYEELKGIASKRGTGMLGSSNK